MIFKKLKKSPRHLRPPRLKTKHIEINARSWKLSEHEIVKQKLELSLLELNNQFNALMQRCFE